jgi:hypothetical protein
MSKATDCDSGRSFYPHRTPPTSHVLHTDVSEMLHPCNTLSENRKALLACVCIPRWCRVLNTCVPHSRLAFLFRIIFQGSFSLATPSTESTVTSCKDIHYICSVFSFMLSPCSLYRHLYKNQLALNARKQRYTSQCAQWCYVNYTGRTESLCPFAVLFCPIKWRIPS